MRWLPTKRWLGRERFLLPLDHAAIKLNLAQDPSAVLLLASQEAPRSGCRLERRARELLPLLSRGAADPFDLVFGGELDADFC
jgi:hypothetical protein